MEEYETHILNFERICRLCLTEKRILTEIFSKTVDSNCLTIDKKIMACASVDLCRDDGLPTRICFKCLSNLNAAFDFRIQCENADKTLHDINNLLLSNNSDKEKNDSEHRPVRAEKNGGVHMGKDPNANISHLIVIKKQIVDTASEDCGDDLFYVVENSISVDRNKDEEKLDVNLVDHVQEDFPDSESSTAQKFVEPNEENSKAESLDGFTKEIKETPKILVNESSKSCKREKHMMGWKKKHGEKGLELKKSPCPFCNKMLTRVHEHIRLLHRNRVYKCTKIECGAEFLTLKNLQSHQLNCYGVKKAYQCPNCLKEFHRKSNFKAHIRRHANTKEFQCQLCDSAFVDSTGLRRHFLKHHEPIQEVFVSGCCGKKFKSKEGLKKHIRRGICGIQIFQVVDSERSVIDEDKSELS